MKIDYNINDFDYNLPQELIADYPLINRDESKLLFFDGNEISHHTFKDISKLLPAESLIVFNKTKVISARLHFAKPTGGIIELLLFEPAGDKKDYQQNLSSFENVVWKCILGGKRVSENMLLTAESGELKVEAKILEKNANEVLAEFSWNQNISFAELLNIIGNVPLPPYIKRKTDFIDKSRYQTVYAKHEGSVAAPTAGLHFTEKVLNDLLDKNIIDAEVTLHVGLGTFLPVSAENVSEHKMHEERILIRTDEIAKIIYFLNNRKVGQRFIATGTTSMRTVESLFWHAYKAIEQGENPEIVSIEQWLPYSAPNLSTADITRIMNKFHELLLSKNISQIEGETSVIIVPSYQFMLIDAIITNFHLPKSTLLLLISAFIGNENRKQIYSEAIRNDYRFLSYGDSSLLFRQ